MLIDLTLPYRKLNRNSFFNLGTSLLSPEIFFRKFDVSFANVKAMTVFVVAPNAIKFLMFKADDANTTSNLQSANVLLSATSVIEVTFKLL